MNKSEIIRKYRWSKKEYLWYKNQNPDTNIIALPVEKPKPFNTNDYEECLF